MRQFLFVVGQSAIISGAVWLIPMPAPGSFAPFALGVGAAYLATLLCWWIKGRRQAALQHVGRRMRRQPQFERSAQG